ncbi:MAG: hypothetical protein ACON34_06130 [Flavobacteriales bacterium]
MKTTDPHTPSSPEALEALLAQKAFVELTDAERAYALEHLESEKEYASMRALLLSISATPAETIAPRPGTKEALMDLFPTEERGGFRVWLNSTWALLVRPSEPWFRQPAFGVALAGIAVVLAGVFVFQPADQDMAFAENRVQTAEETPAASELLVEDEETPAATQEAPASSNATPAPEFAASQDEVDQPQDDAALPPPPEQTLNFQKEVFEDAEVADLITEDVALEDGTALELDAMAEEEEVVFDADFELDEQMPEALADAPATGNTDMAARSGTASTNGLGEGKTFSAPPTALDTQVTFQTASPVDDALFNTSQTPAFDLNDHVEELAGVTISSTQPADLRMTDSRGLDVTFSPGTSLELGESAVKYSGLFDLLETAW